MLRIFGRVASELDHISGFASRPWLLVPICSLLHLTYAVGIWVNPIVRKITALHFADVMFRDALPFVLVAVAVTAVIPMYKKMGPKEIHLFLWPQQFLLCLMVWSTFAAAYAGEYPDGYDADRMFILADQSYTIWLMLGHLSAIIRNARYDK